MDNIIQVKSLNYQSGDQSILKNINLEIARDSYTTFIGPSGSGKSTLMRIIADMITATSGQVIFNSKDLHEYEPTAYRQKVSYAFQQPTLFGKTVKDNLEFPYLVRNQEFDRAKVADYLEMVNLNESYIDKSVNDVSGGEKQRIALLRNLIFPPEVLITDEVTTGLDVENKSIVRHLIDKFNHEYNVTVLRVTHDDTEIAAASHTVTIENGEVKDV